MSPARKVDPRHDEGPRDWQNYFVRLTTKVYVLPCKIHSHLKLLVIPRDLLVDEKEPFFKGAVSPFLSVLNKRPAIVKENLSNNWQFKRRDKFGLTRHKDIPHYTECKNCHQQESKNYTTFCPHAFRA